MIKNLIVFFLCILGFIMLGEYLVDSGKFDQFLDAHPNPGVVPYIDYYIGEIHVVFTDFDSAIYRFERVVKNYPEFKDMPKVMFAIAQSYDDLGNKTLAIREYSKLLKAYPESEYGETARTRLEYLRGY
jgi:TolA-binding protein